MRRRALILIAAALSVVSCLEDRTDRGAIAFSAKDGDPTRALIDDAALKSEGNKLRVFDVLTGFTGNVSWMGEGNSFYINDSLVYVGNPIWNYGSGRIYPWTANGTHKFFSWLRYDQDLDMYETDFFGSSFNTTTKVLSIPQKEMNVSTDQFDFMYSDVLSVDAASHTSGSSVNLQLHHFFTALNLNYSNTSGNRVLLKSITITGMKNRRSATLDFSSSAVQVATSNLASTDIPLYTSTLPEGDTLIHEDRIKPLTDFILMWPQTYTELNGATLVVEYNIIDSRDVVSDDLTANIVLDQQTLFSTNTTGMDAGTKYTFLLLFKKSTIEVSTRALPWEYETYDWDYSDHSISARGGTFRDGVLAFFRDANGAGTYLVEPTAEEWSAKTMRFNTRDEILKGRFYIEAPTSGRWQVTTFPLSAAQYFIIEPTSDEIDVYTDNGKAEFTVRVNTNLNPATTQTLYFNVSIYFNGEWHDANSEFNRKNIKLQLYAN